MTAGLAVLVIDRDPRARAAIIEALRGAGMHAFGAFAPIDAVALLDGISAEVVVLRSDLGDVAVRYLCKRTLVIRVDRSASANEAVRTVMAALGKAPAANPAN